MPLPRATPTPAPRCQALPEGERAAWIPHLARGKQSPNLGKPGEHDLPSAEAEGQPPPMLVWVRLSPACSQIKNLVL